MKNLFTLFIATIFLASCSPEKEDALRADEAGNHQQQFTNFNHQEVPAKLLQLQDTLKTDSVLQPLEGNLFGRFFSDRVEFFIVDKPTNLIQDSRVKFLTMYYVDGQLGQVKYNLEQDVVDRLIGTYGSFRIDGRDSLNRARIKNSEVVTFTPEGMAFNSQLDNYQMKWDLEHAQIVYHVNLRDSLEPYKYIERLKNFESVYRSVRREVYLVKPAENQHLH